MRPPWETSVAVGALGRHAAALKTFTIVSSSIVIEALPFVMLGALVSGLIEVYLSDATFLRLAKLPVALQLPAAALGGVALRVCECGSVPIARRLIARGLHPAAGVAFMLAAPVVNPVVLLSTAVAYQGRTILIPMVAGRAVLGLVLAMVAGWAIGGGRRPEPDLLRAGSEASCSCCDPSVPMSRRARLFSHVSSELFFMGRFIVAGAMLAAALQTIVPQSLLSGLADQLVASVFALMVLAFVLSLCSEADAFVAVSLVQFPIASQLAFLVFGPVVDAKLSFLYSASFKRKVLPQIVVVGVTIVAAGALWFEVLFA